MAAAMMKMAKNIDPNLLMGAANSMGSSLSGQAQASSTPTDTNAVADQLYEKIWPILSDKLCNKFSENAENMSGRIVEYIATKMEEKPEIILVIVKKMLDIMEPPSGVNREAEKKHLVELLDNINKNLEEAKKREEALLAASNIPTGTSPENDPLTGTVVGVEQPIMNSNDLSPEVNNVSTLQTVPTEQGMEATASNLGTQEVTMVPQPGALGTQGVTMVPPPGSVWTQGVNMVPPALAMGALAGTMGAQGTNSGTQALSQLQNMAANNGMNVDAAKNMGTQALGQLQNLSANNGMNMNTVNMGAQAIGQLQNISAATEKAKMDAAKAMGSAALNSIDAANDMKKQAMGNFQNMVGNNPIAMEAAKNLESQAMNKLKSAIGPRGNMALAGLNSLRGLGILKGGRARNTKRVSKMKKRKYTRRITRKS